MAGGDAGAESEIYAPDMFAAIAVGVAAFLVFQPFVFLAAEVLDVGTDTTFSIAVLGGLAFATTAGTGFFLVRERGVTWSPD
jgi:hypothetical protein